MAEQKWLRASITFVLQELRAAAFWTFWGLPTVGTALYLAVSVITGPFGPSVVLGCVVVFAVGCVGGAALEHRRYVKWARETGNKSNVTPLPLPLPKKGSPSPAVDIEPHDGEQGVLLVRNVGGEANFIATGQIVAAADSDMKAITIGHTAPYRMLWLDSETHHVVKGHKHFLKADDDAKLLLASKGYNQFHGNRWIDIRGDAGSVDTYGARYSTESTALVTIEVEIKAEPALLVPYKERFYVVNLQGKDPVVVRNVQDLRTD